jgi:hypothetical protein
MIQRFVPVDKKPEESPPPDPRRTAVIGLLIVVLLIIGGIFLTRVLRHMARVQDCAIAGRSDCSSIE